MKRSISVLVAALLVAVLMANIGYAQTVAVEGKNVVVKHTFYNSMKDPAGFRFAQQEAMVFITKNGNITVELADWGKEDCAKAILVRVTYQNKTFLAPLEFRVIQVAELQLDQNTHLTIGLTELFLGSPTRFASISTSLWVLG